MVIIAPLAHTRSFGTIGNTSCHISAAFTLGSRQPLRISEYVSTKSKES